MNITITGASGFVGSNLCNYLRDLYVFDFIKLLDLINQKYEIDSSVIIHLAGKAHDLKNTANANEYYHSNFDLTKNLFDIFIESDVKSFIFISSVKAVADEIKDALTEEHIPNPITHYGKSKLLAEQYILSKDIPRGKRVYILRPCMIHGPGNKGNLNLLYNLVSKGLPWPLGVFENNRSFLSIENLCFVIKELIEREDIISGVYNVADDQSLSTNELIYLISNSLGKSPKIWNIPSNIVKITAKIGDFLRLPLNTERLNKLTESYLVSNQKIVEAIGKPLPIRAKDGLIKTFNSFKNIKY
jgi:nucleoside-diphosphate-sugar epimerase